MKAPTHVAAVLPESRPLRAEVSRHQDRLDNIDRGVQDIQGTLAEHAETLDHHTVILNQHTEILAQHSVTLAQHTEALAQHTVILNEHTGILAQHTVILNEHSETLAQHTDILNQHTETLNQHTETLRQHGEELVTIKLALGEQSVRIDSLERAMEAGFERMDKRFDALDRLLSRSAGF